MPITWNNSLQPQKIQLDKDLVEFWNKWKENEEINNHNANRLMLAEKFGSPEDYQNIKKLVDKHEEQGFYNQGSDIDKGYFALDRKLSPIMKKKLREQGIADLEDLDYDELEKYFR